MDRRLIIRVWLIVGFLSAGFLFLLRKNLRKDYLDFESAVDVTSANLAYDLVPPRMALMGFMLKEEQLKLAFSPIFSQFSRDDWQRLWHIIYGIYPEYPTVNERVPPRRTQLSIAELEEELASNFPQLFGAFTGEHWKLFWKTLHIRK